MPLTEAEAQEMLDRMEANTEGTYCKEDLIEVNIQQIQDHREVNIQHIQDIIEVNKQHIQDLININIERSQLACCEV